MTAQKKPSNMDTLMKSDEMKRVIIQMEYPEG